MLADKSETRSAFVPESHRTRSVPRYKRPFDIVLSLALILVSTPLLLAIALAVKVTSRGKVLHWSKRVGRNNELFLMPKFRSMRMDAPQVPTHLLSNPSAHLTQIGAILRRSSLDEMPQLFSILMGHLSFVGPRPALFNQEDLIALRTERGIHTLMPGLTGWAQVNGRDELPIPVKVKFDHEYMKRQCLKLDLQIMVITVSKVFSREGIKH